MSNGFMTSLDAGTVGLEEMGNRSDNIMRTELTPVSTTLTSGAGSDLLEIVLENTGQIKMADYDKWDLIVQYFDDSAQYNVVWIPYVDGTDAVYEWDVEGIEMNGQAEVFEPDVLNPGEQITLKTRLYPVVGDGTTNLVVASTSSGVTCSTYFTP